MHTIRQYQLPLQKYMAMMELEVPCFTPAEVVPLKSLNPWLDLIMMWWNNLLGIYLKFSWFCRRGMKDCFTSFSLIMLKSCFPLYTLQQ